MLELVDRNEMAADIYEEVLLMGQALLEEEQEKIGDLALSTEVSSSFTAPQPSNPVHLLCSPACVYPWKPCPLGKCSSTSVCLSSSALCDAKGLVSPSQLQSLTRQNALKLMIRLAAHNLFAMSAQFL